MQWKASAHSANSTDEYLFHQLIPYIGNKRKLLGLIERAINASGIAPETHHFIDLFAGTGVVSRMAKQKGYGVTSNDWEPYSEIINRCYIQTDEAPTYPNNQSYEDVIAQLNALPPREDWVTRHLCPRDDVDYDIAQDRMFYMRKNGLRIDAIRHFIDKQNYTPEQQAALLAPLLYQCCYNANTSGVFKGFHNGWGGQTGTALYRIQGDLVLRPALFTNNNHKSHVTRLDAQKLVKDFTDYTNDKPAFVYLDPPYNQHPYGANYHVLNSVALWDKPELTRQINGRGSKAAIRQDWRTERRSAYNYSKEATDAYSKLLNTIDAPWIATSYSTDGTIPLEQMIKANLTRGDVQVFKQPYKRYRVSTQRYSEQAMTTEFILLTDTTTKSYQSVDEIIDKI